jgi:hypothetical protein
VDSSYITEPQATSDIPAGLSDPVGGTFVFGEVKEDDNTTGSIPLDACEYTEIEFVIRATGNATNSGDYCFQLYDTTNNKTLSYSKYAEVSLADGTFLRRTWVQVVQRIATKSAPRQMTQRQALQMF